MSKQAKSRRIPVSVSPDHTDIPQHLTILHRAKYPLSPHRWVILDAERKEVVVAFAQKPAPSILSRLKGAGFRRAMKDAWSWSKRQNAESLAFAGRLAGVPTPISA